MKSAILVVVLLVAGVVGLSFYMGWFTLSSSSDGNKDNVTLTVDKDKIQEDKDDAVNKVQGLGRETKEETTATE